MCIKLAAITDSLIDAIELCGGSGGGGGEYSGGGGSGGVRALEEIVALMMRLRNDIVEFNIEEYVRVLNHLNQVAATTSGEHGVAAGVGVGVCNNETGHISEISSEDSPGGSESNTTTTANDGGVILPNNGVSPFTQLTMAFAMTPVNGQYGNGGNGNNNNNNGSNNMTDIYNQWYQ